MLLCHPAIAHHLWQKYPSLEQHCVQFQQDKKGKTRGQHTGRPPAAPLCWLFCQLLLRPLPSSSLPHPKAFPFPITMVLVTPLAVDSRRPVWPQCLLVQSLPLSLSSELFTESPVIMPTGGGPLDLLCLSAKRNLQDYTKHHLIHKIIYFVSSNHINSICNMTHIRPGALNEV